MHPRVDWAIKMAKKGKILDKVRKLREMNAAASGGGEAGACAAPDGQRICVDGPFLQAAPAKPISV